MSNRALRLASETRDTSPQLEGWCASAVAETRIVESQGGTFLAAER